MKCFVKWYIKRLNKQQRPLRELFRGTRLKVKQYRWLHFNGHPWELDKENANEKDTSK